jgi:hypothetical protein
MCLICKLQIRHGYDWRSAVHVAYRQQSSDFALPLVRMGWHYVNWCRLWDEVIQNA